MAALLSGQSVSTIASQYRIDRTVVYRMKSELSSEKLQQVATQKADEFGELLSDFLREALKTLKAQMEFCKDRSWLAKQEAAQVATLVGVTTDKVVRLLEAAQASELSESEQPGPD